MGEEITKAMEPHELFHFTIAGHKIPVNDTVVIMWFVMAVLIVGAIIFTRNLKKVPDKKQNIAEMVVDFVNNLTKGMIGHHWKHFSAYLGSVILFLAVANIISVFNIIPWRLISHSTGIHVLEEFGMRPPTKDINVTACLAIMSIVLVLFSGIRFKGLGGWLKDFAKPNPIVLPFKILDYFVRPTSLCLRLFGNVLGAFIIMELIYAAFPPVVPAALSVYFDLFDGLLQAYIFVFLTSLYIAEVIE